MTDEELAASRERMRAIAARWENCAGHFWAPDGTWEGPGLPMKCAACSLMAFCLHEAEALNRYRQQGIPSREWPEKRCRGGCTCDADYRAWSKEKRDREKEERRGQTIGWIGYGEGEPWKDGAAKAIPDCNLDARIRAGERGGSRVSDAVKHPDHYNQHDKIECWDINEQLPGNLAAAFKHLWRCGLKGSALEDLRKAEQYIEREIARCERAGERMFSGRIPIDPEKLNTTLERFPGPIYMAMTYIIYAAWALFDPYPGRPLRSAQAMIRAEINRLELCEDISAGIEEHSWMPGEGTED